MQILRAQLVGIVRLLRPVWSQCNEFALGIQTDLSASARAAASAGDSPGKGAPTDKAKHKDNLPYATPDYWYVRKVVSVLNPGPDDTVYDLGCGLGRFLCTVARKRVRRCVGIELFEPMCVVAEKNAQTLRGRKSRIDIICADVLSADLSDGTVYFMFNPFGADTMKDVVTNIKASLVSNPRSVRIAYYNSALEHVLVSSGWLEKYHCFFTHAGHTVTFWRSRLS
jgi:precorrin-6B methylase 2